VYWPAGMKIGKLIFEQERSLERWEQFFSILMKTGKKFEGNKGKKPQR
jgi:hypothetical protein